MHPAEELDELLGEADAIVLALPLTDATRGLIDAGRLTRIRPGVRLVNVGRGPLVEEEALLAALRSGHVANAALDVFDTEPLPRTTLSGRCPGRGLPAHVLGPGRVGGGGGRAFADNLRRYLARPLRNVVGDHPVVVGAGA